MDRMGKEQMSAIVDTHNGSGHKAVPVNGNGSNGHSVVGISEGHSTTVLQSMVSDVIAAGRSLDEAMAEIEAAVIRAALQEQRGNRSAAARQLQLPRQTLQDRMKKHGLWSS